MNNQPVKYAGFWLRFAAFWIDSILLFLILTPILWHLYGIDYFLSTKPNNDPLHLFITYGLPALATVIFWHYKSATPGKMILHLEIADANTLQKPSTLQFIVRYFAYIVSIVPFFLGFLWIAFDAKKQGWHDKIAQTVVIKNKVEFHEKR